MKVTKAQVRENRERIVETASVLFRERGYDGVGVAELMATAGFTHGGFYKHFGSKADLMAEATACSFAKSRAESAEVDINDFVQRYLSREHRDSPGQGCTMAALCADAGRQNVHIKQTFAAGIEQLLATFAEKETHLNPDEQNKARADRIAVMSQAVGALVLSRSCPDDSALADEILEVCRTNFIDNCKLKP
jgi:TetR/AcrR family transcriptional repressor of nem operon